MTSLFENPVPIILFGIVAEAVLGIILLTSRRGALLWAMGGVLVLMLAGVGLERLVVTEWEQVEATLEGAAAALQANDQTRLLGSEEFLAESAVETRGRVRYALNRIEFTKVKITDLEIKINRLTSPPTATARVAAYVRFEDPTGQIIHEKYLIKDLNLRLRQTPQGWRIVGHQWKNDPGRF